jgi:hypothetical protein
VTERSLASAALLACLLIPPAAAQELQALDLNDFLDPRLLTVSEEGGEAEPISFFTSRLAFGFLDQYQRRSQITETGFRFGRIIGNFYSGKNQFNIELTQFDRLGKDADAIGETRIQWGRYFTGAAADGEEFTARLLLSWRTTTGEQAGFEDELSVIADYAFPISDRLVYGGYVYTFVPDSGDHYLSYAFRDTVQRWQMGFRLDVGLGLGAEFVDESARWGHTRLELALVAPLPRFNTDLRLVYAPYYHPTAAKSGEVFGQEIGVFFDGAVFSKIFHRGSG